MRNILKQGVISALLLTGLSAPAFAQLNAPNAAGVTVGHAHFTVPDTAKHQQIWEVLGGKVKGRLIELPGIYIMLTAGERENASPLTTANHVGFSIQNYADYKAKLAAVGAEIFFDNEENGQILADLPDGVRIELQVVEDLQNPIEFHHYHLSALEAEELRDWYVKVFSAEVGERRGLPSAVLHEGRVDFIPARGEAPLASITGAFDHIGFEVDDMDAFAAHLKAINLAFDSEPRSIANGSVIIAFFTDPAGTRIEVTQDLGNLAN